MSANSQVARNQSRQTLGSVYESTNSLSTIYPLGSHYQGGQRMVEWFTGKSLNTDRWNVGTHSGTSIGTVSVSTEIDGGIKILTGSGNYGHVWYSFQTEQLNGGSSQLSPQQFSKNNSVFIDVFKHTADSAQNVLSSSGGGLGGGNSSAGRGDQGSEAGVCGVFHHCKGNYTYFTFRTALDGGYGSDINSGVAYDTNWHTNRIQLNATSADWAQDGVYIATRTDYLPDNDMAPLFGAFKYTVAGQVGIQVRYCEAYNL